jgi:hypothetical protein
LMPPSTGERPRGMGHEQWESWTLTGAPLEDVLIGDVYTDGSCVKDGPPLVQTGWAVVKISQDWVVLGWARGTVGSKLPQSSPASEHVAALALATIAKAPACAASDYEGLAALEAQDADTVSYRKSIYAEVKLEIRGRAPTGFRVRKVRGHVNPETCTSRDEWRDAVGNQFADSHARTALSTLTPSPTVREWEDWAGERVFFTQVSKARAQSFSFFSSGEPHRWQTGPPQAGGGQRPSRAREFPRGRPERTWESQ